MLQLAYSPRHYHTLNLLGDVPCYDEKPEKSPSMIIKQLINVQRAGLYPAVEAAMSQGIPAEILLGWPAVESDWKISSGTSLNERGYFQLSPSESASIGVDHDLLSTDPAYSFQAGVDLINQYRNQVAQDGTPESSEMFWPLVKFYHTIGRGGANQLMSALRNAGVEPQTWQDVVDYKDANPGMRFGGHCADKWVPNPAKVLKYGKWLAAAGKFKLFTSIGGTPGAGGFPIVALGAGLLFGVGAIFGVRAIKRRVSARRARG